MRNFNVLLYSLLWGLCSLGLLPGAHAQTTITLPVEVVGAQGPIEDVTLAVGNASKASSLYLRVHQPGFRGSTNPSIARASIRLNGGSWMDLTNANAEPFAHDAAYGGIGGFQTVRLKVAGSKLGTFKTSNTLSIRLNQTDGHSSGLRVLEVNLFDAGGSQLMPASAFVQDDPTKWTAPRTTSADLAEGRKLWHEAQITESPISSKILRATCSAQQKGIDIDVGIASEGDARFFQPRQVSASRG